MEFRIPYALEDLVLTKKDRSFVTDQSIDPIDAINTINDSIDADPLSLSDLLNEGYCAVKGFSSLCGGDRRRVIDGLCHATRQLAREVATADRESSARGRDAVRLACFWTGALLHRLDAALEDSAQATAQATAAKKKGAKRGGAAAGQGEAEGLNAAEARADLAGALAALLKAEPAKFWPMGAVEEELSQQFIKAGIRCLEDPLKDKEYALPTKQAAFDLLCLTSKMYNQAVHLTVSLMHLLHNHEHTPVVIAELFEVMVVVHKDTVALGNLLREIGRMTADEMARDTAGVRSLSVFLPELASKLPKEVLANVSVLYPHLNAESYMMRNAIIQTIGFLVLKAFGEDATAAAAAAASVASGADGDEAGSGKVADNTTRDSLLGVLEERYRDVTSYTRAKVLQTWQMLFEERAVPLARLARVTAIACGRLEDKSAIVRKNAMQLLSSLLRNNPFAAELRLSSFEQRLEACKAELAAAIANPEGHTEEDAAKQRHLISFLTSAIGFVAQVHEAVPVASRLLGSKQTFDVTEAIDLLVTCAEFGIENVLVGIRKMLALVWSKEPAIRDAMIEAYKRLYLDVKAADAPAAAAAAAAAPGKKSKAAAAAAAAALDKAAVSSTPASMAVARNLIRLASGATLSELTSLEELLCHFVKARHVTAQEGQALWEVLSAASLPMADRRGALMVLSMMVAAAPEIMRGKAAVLMAVGLGEAGQADPMIARYTCVTLQRLATDDTRVPATHPIISRLRAVLMGHDFALADPEAWCSVAEQALNAIFAACDHPDVVAGSIVRELAAACFGLTNNKQQQQQQLASPRVLSNFLFVAGHVAVKMLVHLEERVKALKRRRAVGEQLRAQDASSAAAAAASKKAGGKAGNAVEEELGLGTVANEERENEIVAEIAEKDIVMRNLLGLFGPAIARICANVGGAFGDSTVRSSAVLALCKYASVSSEFCEKHLPLIFTLLERTPEPEIRCNIIIALGDLCFRFPNTLDPWGSRIYARLKDSDTAVRMHCLMVLTHLILHGMIKIKGQISEMVLCLEDPDPRIADLARLFLHELSRKSSSPIYNLLPDMISHLSVTPGLSTEGFRSILRHVISFVDKDKQSESLIEKLCHRFLTTDDPVQWRNFAYAISLLNISERGVKKLQESIRCYADKLVDDEVWALFSATAAKARKAIKADQKSLIDEYEVKINEIRTKHVGDTAAGNAAVAAATAAATANGDDDDEATGAENNNSGGNQPQRSSARSSAPSRKVAPAPAAAAAKKGAAASAPAKGKGKGKKAAVSDSESSSDVSLLDASDEKPVVQTATTKRRAAATTSRR